MKKRLTFKGSGSNYEIFNDKKQALGVIWFHNMWKCYVWEQYEGIIMSKSCLDELTEYIRKLEANKKYGKF